jgi:Holliday junction resolvase
MKPFRRSVPVLLAFLIAGTSLTASAQQGPAKVGCVDRNIRLQADELKQHYAREGFAVVRDAMIGMVPRMPFPVVIALRSDTRYRIIFTGNSLASAAEIEVRDGSEKQIVMERNRFKDDQPRVVDIAFQPKRSDAYLFILQQRMRGEETCGSFTIMRDTVVNRAVPVRSFSVR